MVYYGIIQENKTLSDMPEVFNDYWQRVEINGVEYMSVKAFSHYFTEPVAAQFNLIFTTGSAYHDYLSGDGYITVCYDDNGFVGFSERSFTGTLEDIQVFANAKGFDYKTIQS